MVRGRVEPYPYHTCNTIPAPIHWSKVIAREALHQTGWISKASVDGWKLAPDLLCKLAWDSEPVRGVVQTISLPNALSAVLGLVRDDTHHPPNCQEED